MKPPRKVGTESHDGYAKEWEETPPLLARMVASSLYDLEEVLCLCGLLGCKKREAIKVTIDGWFEIEEKLRPNKMRRWISRSKNLFQDVIIKIYIKVKETDVFYCSNCGAMPNKAFGSPDPNDPMDCEKCFRDRHSADEFLT